MENRIIKDVVLKETFDLRTGKLEDLYSKISASRDIIPESERENAKVSINQSAGTAEVIVAFRRAETDEEVIARKSIENAELEEKQERKKKELEAICKQYPDLIKMVEVAEG